MYELLMGKPPFNGKDYEDLKKNIDKGIIVMNNKADLSPNCLDFLSKCL